MTSFRAPSAPGQQMTAQRVGTAKPGLRAAAGLLVAIGCAAQPIKPAASRPPAATGPGRDLIGRVSGVDGDVVVADRGRNETARQVKGADCGAKEADPCRGWEPMSPTFAQLACARAILVLQFIGCEGGMVRFSVERVIGHFAPTQLTMAEGTEGLRCQSLEWNSHRYRLLWFMEDRQRPDTWWYISPDDRVAWDGVFFSPWPPAPSLADALRTLEAERSRGQCQGAGEVHSGEKAASGGE